MYDSCTRCTGKTCYICAVAEQVSERTGEAEPVYRISGNRGPEGHCPPEALSNLGLMVS